MNANTPDTSAPVSTVTEQNDELLDELLENVTGGSGATTCFKRAEKLQIEQSDL